MPRQNARGSIASEANLAKRIAREREAMGLSYEALSRLMAEAGRPINASALFKIEKGQPPRKITVDELVAFAKVFDTPIEGLLIPLELIDKERAEALVRAIQDSDDDFADYLAKALSAHVEWYDLARGDPELNEYAFHLLDSTTPPGTATPLERISVDRRFSDYEVDLSDLDSAARNLELMIMRSALRLRNAIESSEAPSDGQ